MQEKWRSPAGVRHLFLQTPYMRLNTKVPFPVQADDPDKVQVPVTVLLGPTPP